MQRIKDKINIAEHFHKCALIGLFMNNKFTLTQGVKHINCTVNLSIQMFLFSGL